MAHRALNDLHTVGRKKVHLAFSIKANGTSSPTTIEQDASKPVAAVVRSGVGVLGVGLADSWPATLLHSHCQVRGVAGKRAYVLSWTQSTKTLVIVTEAVQSGIVEWFKDEDDAAASTATAERTIYRAKNDVALTAARYTPNAAVAADASNTVQITIDKRPVAGYGTPVLAADYDSTTGQNGAMTAFTPAAFDMGSVANRTLVSGDTLTVEIAKSGTGVILPAGVLDLDFSEASDIPSGANNYIDVSLTFDEATQI